MKLLTIFCGMFLAASLTLPAVAKQTESKIGKTEFSLVRDSGDFTRLPKLKAENPSGTAVEFKVKSVLLDRNGKAEEVYDAVLAIPAGEKSVELDPFNGKRSAVTGDVKLFKAEISGQGGSTAVSGIFGEAKPVSASGGDLFGMNVHLGRYDADVQWELLQLLADAGITQVRCDFSFGDPVKMKKEGFVELKQTVLGLEAFGIRPLVLLGYFPPSFSGSPDKLKMAHDWAEIVARELKGRVDYNYGNETNSGWAGFGEASAMAALNNAFALGTSKGDASAGKGSFGIAEGLENYVVEFIRAGTLNYLDAVCLHPYCGVPEAGIAKSSAAKEHIRATGGAQQTWLTEIGFHVDDNGKFNELTGELTGVGGFTLRHQAEFLPRLFVLGKSYGIDRIYWYDFFGRDDRETFWLIDEHVKPRPAYHALAECSKRLKNTEPVDRTGFGELVQRHTFRRPDGSLLLVAWALKDNVPADFRLPVGSKVFDREGKAADVPASGFLMLGHSPVYIENAPAPVLDAQVIASAMDRRNFNNPLFRFEVKPGASVDVPFVLFNGSPKAVSRGVKVLGTWPGWKMELPDMAEVPAGGTGTANIRLTAPAAAVPGVEYEFTFAGVLDGYRQTAPYTVRVRTEGKFPYGAIRESAKSGDYPMWDAMDERRTETGNPELTAAYGTVVINGDLSDWKAEEFFPIDQRFQWILRDPGVPSTEDWSGQAAFRWDENKLYAAFLIQDDDLCFNDQVSRDWRDCDNVRLLVSSIADKAKRPQKISESDLLLIMTPTGITRTENPMLNAASLGGLVRDGVENQVEIKSRVWKNGYLLEVAVPFALFKAKPEAGVILGLNVMADDVDRYFRQHVGMTYYRNANYWNSPAATGNLKLVK